MGAAEKLKRLVRIIPGVAGYQDNESLRETDKVVRLRLSAELEGIRLAIEGDKRRLMERRDLSLLPRLDRITSKLDKTANLIQYASRGYSGVFDAHRIDTAGIGKLYDYDLGLFEGIESLRTAVRVLRDAPAGGAAMQEAASKVEGTLEELERKFLKRQDALTTAT